MFTKFFTSGCALADSQYGPWGRNDHPVNPWIMSLAPQQYRRQKKRTKLRNRSVDQESGIASALLFFTPKHGMVSYHLGATRQGEGLYYSPPPTIVSRFDSRLTARVNERGTAQPSLQTEACCIVYLRGHLPENWPFDRCVAP
jgi:hypothetical protein